MEAEAATTTAAMTIAATATSLCTFCPSTSSSCTHIRTSSSNFSGRIATLRPTFLTMAQAKLPEPTMHTRRGLTIFEIETLFNFLLTSGGNAVKCTFCCCRCVGKRLSLPRATVICSVARACMPFTDWRQGYPPGEDVLPPSPYDSPTQLSENVYYSTVRLKLTLGLYSGPLCFKGYFL